MGKNMRYSEKELAQFGCSAQADLEGRLNYRPPSGSFSQSGFKERWFKLKANFLFYFRISELGVIDRKEPAGVFVLENYSIQSELTPGVPFSFSIMFQDDNDKKHVFSTRTEDQIQQWVSAIKACSYEHWRSQLRMMQSKIKRITGKDPLIMYPGYSDSYVTSVPSESLTISALSLSPARPSRSPHRKATSFKCHLTPENRCGPHGKLQDPRSSALTSSFQSHLPITSTVSHLETGIFKNVGSLSQFGGSTGSLASGITLPPPPRPSRSSNRSKASEVVPLVATRTAPPPPPSSTKNLIEF